MHASLSRVIKGGLVLMFGSLVFMFLAALFVLGPLFDRDPGAAQVHRFQLTDRDDILNKQPEETFRDLVSHEADLARRHDFTHHDLMPTRPLTAVQADDEGQVTNKTDAIRPDQMPAISKQETGNFIDGKVRGFRMPNLEQLAAQITATPQIIRPEVLAVEEVQPTDGLRPVNLPMGVRLQGRLINGISPEQGYPVMLQLDDHLLGPATLRGQLLAQADGYRIDFDLLAMPDGRNFALKAMAIDPENQRTTMGSAAMPLRILGKLGETVINTASLLVQPFMLSEQVVRYGNGNSVYGARQAAGAYGNMAGSTLSQTIGSEMTRLGAPKSLDAGQLLHVLITEPPRLVL
ncbi:MAG: hypothetical protein CML57_09410 [Rhodobacteraceae bacterium]|nr:hypothetical protein [Paracoccaceae bacterium]|tara:strand:- start:2074 stop:3117 length:1044 start_codon:yes stop_codon:yes gene_type:complete